MGNQREPSEGEAVRDLPIGEGEDVDDIHGEDPGLDAADLADQVADPLVEEGRPYLPVGSLGRQAETLLVYGKRVGGPIGILLDIAGTSINIALMQYKRLYGEHATGPAPDYDDPTPTMPGPV